MQFLNSLFGSSGNEILTTAFALGIVLVLIVLGLWLLKLLMRFTSSMGKRSRRLAVVETVPVDSRRRLLIVRRDNVEHLILTGGAEDLVVETGIPVERPTLPVRRPADARPPEPRPARPQRQPPVRAPVAKPAETPAPPAAETPPATPPRASGVDRLRELSRPNGQRSSFSLRHTGLMRPVSRLEPGLVPVPTENPGAVPADSDKLVEANEARGPLQLGEGTKGSSA